MGYLSCISLTKIHIFASLPNNSPPQFNRKPPVRRVNSTPSPTIQQQQQKQPSIAEIERAIGAGIFRDRDTSNMNSEQNKTLFDTIFSNFVGKTEGSIEKKLRETGEWIIDRSESAPRSAGKKILMFVFLWILPMWILSFLVASGLIRLPYSIPFLDDLIM